MTQAPRPRAKRPDKLDREAAIEEISKKRPVLNGDTALQDERHLLEAGIHLLVSGYMARTGHVPVIGIEYVDEPAVGQGVPRALIKVRL